MLWFYRRLVRLASSPTGDRPNERNWHVFVTFSRMGSLVSVADLSFYRDQ
jgi:hypothetical protein